MRVNYDTKTDTLTLRVPAETVRHILRPSLPA